MSYESLGRSDDIPYAQIECSALGLQGGTSNSSNLNLLQRKTHFCRGQTSVSISIDHQCKANEGAMRSPTGEYFFGEIPEASSSSVDAGKKPRQTAVPSQGRSICGEDNVLCFELLYDGQRADNINNAATRSVGVSSQSYPVSHSVTLSEEAFDSHSSEINDAYDVATSLGSVHQGCRAIESYFENMQAIGSVDESLNDVNENGSKSSSRSSVKIFHGEKRLGDDTYICNRAGDKQTPFGKHSVYSESFIGNDHNPVQTHQQSESREGGKNAEIKGKKNGEARHSRDGSGGGSVVDEAEILHPQANFQQSGFIHKLRLVEEARDSGLGQVNSMLISSTNQDVDINLSQELANDRSDKGTTFASGSPLKSFLTHDFMSPDHQSNIARKSSARSDFGEEMHSLLNNTETNGSPDGSMNSDDTMHHSHDATDRMNNGNDKVGGTLCSEGRSNNDGEIENGSPDTDSSKSRENESAAAKQKNGESRHERENGDTSLGKHIYPWMKDTRQNTRRKQSTSSNSSGNGDKSSKRERTAYTNSQLVELEKEFHFNRYLCRPRRIEMAQMLNLTERQIKIWFQNRRMKYKKDQKLKTMPMNSLVRDASFYHQHHHPPNMNSDALFSRNNDHRHYPEGRHVHSAETTYRSVPADGSSSGHAGMDCTSGGRWYHGHRHHGGHISQDSSVLIQQPLVRTSSNAYDRVNKTYPQSNQKANSGGRLTSPSSSSSPGTLSPGNGRSSGGYGSEIAMRSTPSSGSEAQTLTQPGCGFLPHVMSPNVVVSPNVPSNSIDDESPVSDGKHTSGLECRRLLNHTAYDMSFSGHGFSPFSRRMDNIATRMQFGNGGTGIGQQISAMSNHYFGGYERQKDSTAYTMITDPSSSMQNRAVGNTHYAQFHNPLESLNDCVQRSRDFPNQALNGTRYSSMGAYSASFTASNANSFDRSRYERSSEPSPLDFSRSKSSSPRAQHSEVYLNNRLTHL